MSKPSLVLELGVVGCTREGNDVTNVGHTGHEEHKTLKSESESCMRNGAETTGVKIPPHVLHGDVELLDASEKLVVVLLTLRAADNLSDLREEDIHGPYGLSVVVELHVEGLYLLGIVGKYHRTLEMLLDEITLMLALKVGAPIYGNSNL